MRRFTVLGVVVAAVVLVAGGCVDPPPPPPGEVTATVTVGGEVVTVSVPAGLTVTVDSADLGALPAVPEGLVFPLGALDITVGGVTPGGVAHVTVTLPSAVDSVVKLIGGVWDPFTPDGTTGATLSPDGMTTTVDLQDGGRGDNDNTADGTIVDPLAPANAQVPPPCIELKPTLEGIVRYLQWNGQIGPARNVPYFTDPACTIPVEPLIAWATFTSPAPPVPSPYTSWVDVPWDPATGPPITSSPETLQALAVCIDMFPGENTPESYISFNYFQPVLTSVGNIPDTLWGCGRFSDNGTQPPTQVLPL